MRSHVPLDMLSFSAFYLRSHQRLFGAFKRSVCDLEIILLLKLKPWVRVTIAGVLLGCEWRVGVLWQLALVIGNLKYFVNLREIAEVLRVTVITIAAGGLWVLDAHGEGWRPFVG